MTLPNSHKQHWFFTTPVLLATSLLIVLLDRLTKYLCDTFLTYGQPRTVFEGFDLLLAYNSGAAFSFLSDAGGWQRWFLTGLSMIVSMLILFWLVRLSKRERLLALSLCLILGGALGNLYDRIFYGYVIDFISVYYQQYRFATFNIADSAVSVGAGLMILEVILGKPEQDEKIPRDTRESDKV
ncbi:MAG: signal peptidase II [Gammaproteobacteria bacterium]|nr:signal peptidase II [Gammaproteobacteria bacterium]MAY01776.1 signal peptidase II [Gammaproteobacteria bacterium]|tara:strand:+ start:422 stop:970 length:549 start_codon:yes stop_codon:yes gene_type:complete